MWFNEKDFINFPIIKLSDIKGYVLPHAATKYTGHIISHTLRFKPKFYFTKVCIIFSPANQKPNVHNQFHEYYVVQKSFEYIYINFWGGKRELQYIPYNIRDNHDFSINLDNTLIIISADFSHFLSLKKAISLENCAAHSILQKYLHPKCCDIIDTKDQFKQLYKIIPQSWMLQWIGRTRSSGKEGVGYLSFLIRDTQSISIPDGLFVTAYDTTMRQRECLGDWFDKDNIYTHKKLIKKIREVIHKARTTSRLTGGKYLSTPIYGYTVTYLYEDNTKKFIRGWHGVKTDAFYLPDVFLENTFNNGEWITPTSKEWPQNYDFNMKETLEKLSSKAKAHNTINVNSSNYKLYFSQVIHYKL